MAILNNYTLSVNHDLKLIIMRHKSKASISAMFSYANMNEDGIKARIKQISDLWSAGFSAG